MDNDMEQLLGFASFGKRQRSKPANDHRIKAAKVEYVAEPIEFLRAEPASSLNLVALEATVASTTADDEAADAVVVPELMAALKVLLDVKSTLHDRQLSAAAYREARARANPWESLGKWSFVNRSAMKMAELDARLHLTTASISSGDLSFVDLCGAPGGFSEYLAFRANYANVRGHGISIRVPGSKHLDWQLPPRAQDVVAVSHGADDTGDLYKQPNLDHFVEAVLRSHPSGVNLAVADGGFQDARNHENQEAVMHRLVLCEVLVMCRVLQSGGHFVCKTFELSSLFSLGLLWVLHHLFDEVAIVKPVTSRPASSERYIVGRGWRVFQPHQVIRHLTTLNAAFDSNTPPTAVVNMSALRKDGPFLGFVERSGIHLATNQSDAIVRIMRVASETDRSTSGRVVVSDVLNQWGLSS